MVQVFLGMVAVGVIVVVSKNITFVVFVVVIAMMLAMVVVVMLVVVMNHPPTPLPPIESIYGRTKMVAQSPAALEYLYYNLGLNQWEGFRPFRSKGDTGTPRV